MESVDELKKTLNLLKQALLLERSERAEAVKSAESLKQNLKSLDERIEKSNNTLAKVSKDKISFQEELQKSEERLKTISKNKPLPSKASGSSRSIQALENQNEKLLEEYNLLRRENEGDESKISALKQEFEGFKNTTLSQDQEIKEISANLDKKDTEYYIATQQIKEEIADYIKRKQRVSEKNAEMTEELNKLTRKNLRLQEDLTNLKAFIENKTELETRLMDSVRLHEKSEVSLANQLLQIKSELLDAQTFYQEFSVQVVSLMIKCNGKLIFKRDADGEYLMEFHYKSKKDQIFLKDVDDVFEHPKKEDRLVIKYKNKSRDVVTEDRVRIVTRIRELIQRCIRQ